MSNGAACCVLGICCDAFSAKQKKALSGELLLAGLDEAAATMAADFILSNYDLAPMGTLTEFKTKVAAMARLHGKKDDA